MGEHESFLGTSQGAEVDSKPQPCQPLIILSPISSTHDFFYQTEPTGYREAHNNHHRDVFTSL